MKIEKTSYGWMVSGYTKDQRRIILQAHPNESKNRSTITCHINGEFDSKTSHSTETEMLNDLISDIAALARNDRNNVDKRQTGWRLTATDKSGRQTVYACYKFSNKIACYIDGVPDRTDFFNNEARMLNSFIEVIAAVARKDKE